jgi:glyoxylase-like metal-dependent hydrolase (beta-lactamase superfamily II)
MKINDRISLVGSGDVGGLSLSHSLDCNIYLINGGTELALIDAGVGIEPDLIFENIARDGYDLSKLRYLLITHAHYDHSGGASKLRDRFSLKVVGSPLTKQWLESADAVSIGFAQAQAAGLYPVDLSLVPCSIDLVMNDKDRLQIGNLHVQCISTPGHSGGHISYLLEEDRALFSGDCIFAGGKIILQNLGDCTLSDSVSSLKKLSNFEINMLFPSHGLFAINRGQRHIDKANRQLDLLQIPQKADLD